MWHYEGVRQANDLFVYFGAKTNKGLSSRSRRDRKWARERERRSWKKDPEKAVGDGWRRVAVDTEQQKKPVGMR